MRLSLALAIALVGCEARVTENSPPVVSEPTAGLVSDRALIRVHMSAPGQDTSIGTRYQGSLNGTHANWRVNGGATFEVDKPTTDRDPDQSFVFAAKLVEGANALELGRCTALDQCGWTTVSVTLKTGPGSPDPSFGGSGQLIEPKLGRAEGVAVFADGRVLVAAEGNEPTTPKMGLIMFKPDGTKDTTWGTGGIATLTIADARALLLPRPNGGVLAIFSRTAWAQTYVARFDGSGKLDTAFGDPALGGEVRVFPWQGAAGGVLFDAMVDGAGHVLVAGQERSLDRLSTPPFIQTLDFDLQPLALAELRTGAPEVGTVVAASFDATGHAAFLLDDRITRGSASGVDLGFGTAGRVSLPADASTVGAVVLRADGSVVAARKVPGQLRVWWVSPTGSAASFDVPSDAPYTSTGSLPLVLEASDAGVYLATTAVLDADPVRSWIRAQEPGTQLVVYRLNDGAVDPTFGAPGRASASMALSWTPVATESLFDAPGAMAIDARGSPLVVGGSTTTGAASQQSYTRRGPGTAVVRFLP